MLAGQETHGIRTLDFSEVYRCSGASLVRVSPDAGLVATGVEHRVVVRDADSLAIALLFSMGCADTPDILCWSPDSTLIAAACSKRGYAQVWNVLDESWKCVLSEGVSGLSAMVWAPDARHLLVFSNFQLRITVWSLITKEAVYIQYPKFKDKGYCFRSDGRYFALSERKECKDTISIYDCHDWTLLKHFPVDTFDLEDIAWSPDGRFIAVWESLLEYKMLIYSPDGRLISSYSAYESGLGIKNVSWSPSAQFLAIGSFDEKLRLLHNVTWKPLIDLSHPSQLPFPDIPVFKESNMRDIKDVSKGKIWSATVEKNPRIHYELARPPVTVPSIRVDVDKPVVPKKGVGLCEFSCTGRYLGSKNENMPNVLWIWDLTTLSQVALIQQLSPIRSVVWNPVRPGVCAISCGNNYVYLWAASEDTKIDYNDRQDKLAGACSAIEVPAVNFQIAAFCWSPDGRSLVLIDKDKFCIAYLVEEM